MILIYKPDDRSNFTLECGKPPPPLISTHHKEDTQRGHIHNIQVTQCNTNTRYCFYFIILYLFKIL